NFVFDSEESNEDWPNKYENTLHVFNPNAVFFSEGSKLSYIGQNCEEIPQELAELYGHRVLQLDLGHNLISDVGKLNTQFPSLQELILDSNCIGDSLNVPPLPRLTTLTLNKNQISDLESFLDKVAHRLPSLSYLSLLGNAACPNQLSSVDADEEDYQRYRYFVIYKLPKLKFLDFKPVSKGELEEALKRGVYTKVIRYWPNEEVDADSGSSPESASKLTPLPSQTRNNDHYAIFGQSKYVYYGRHSEGNRFIRNHDL
ncbi:PREDICTED: leucine-rich repeat-containing protein C10orf11 homolog, partial [Priapulus caudatus]|uniref:Leucine-rich repeat-containing protein C10orf11 homolog n=1 Tax=Priapulus caudatus TaxID=37621 RepID=A0ABM1EN34_PRICU